MLYIVRVWEIFFQVFSGLSYKWERYICIVCICSKVSSLNTSLLYNRLNVSLFGVDSFQRMFCDIWVDFMRLYNNLLWYSYLEIFLLILTWATSPSHINTPVSFSNWMLSVLCKVEGLQPTLYMYHCTTSLPLVFDIRLLTVNLFLQAQHYKSSVKDFS